MAALCWGSYWFPSINEDFPPLQGIRIVSVYVKPGYSVVKGTPMNNRSLCAGCQTRILEAWLDL